MKKAKRPSPRKATKVDSQKSTLFRLKLYVAGNEPNSQRAIEILKEIFNIYGEQNFDLKIIDVFQDFKSALKDKILVAPTLVWERKECSSQLVGNFSRERLLEFLGLPERAGGEK